MATLLTEVTKRAINVAALVREKENQLSDFFMDEVPSSIRCDFQHLVSSPRNRVFLGVFSLQTKGGANSRAGVLVVGTGWLN